jgi:hypothetical protein
MNLSAEFNATTGFTLRRLREVDKDEKINNDQLDFIGYFLIERVSLCLARPLSWSWPFRGFYCSPTYMGGASSGLFPRVLPTTQLLWIRLLLQ